MGVRDLWEVSSFCLSGSGNTSVLPHSSQLLSPTAEIHSLTDLTVIEGFKRGIKGDNTFDLGIDIRYVKFMRPAFEHL